MAFQRWHRAVEETGGNELNVIPVMNLFMVLIPFLMLGAAFYHVGVIPVSTPTHNPSESDVPKTPTTVTGNLVIGADSVKLTFSSTNLSESDLLAISGEWKADATGAFDLDSIQAKLKTVKGSYPKSTTVVVLPHDSINYQTLVGVLDVIREYEDGVDARGEAKFQELFPVTVFSRFIPPPPPEEGEAGEDEMDFEIEDGVPEDGSAPEPVKEEAPQ